MSDEAEHYSEKIGDLLRMLVNLVGDAFEEYGVTHRADGMWVLDAKPGSKWQRLFAPQPRLGLSEVFDLLCACVDFIPEHVRRQYHFDPASGNVHIEVGPVQTRPTEGDPTAVGRALELLRNAPFSEDTDDLFTLARQALLMVKKQDERRQSRGD